jgi:hypothetical protein
VGLDEMEITPLEKFIRFLQDDVGVPSAEIGTIEKLVSRDSLQNLSLNLLAIVLWQYGLLNLEQLSRVFDWLEMLVGR